MALLIAAVMLYGPYLWCRAFGVDLETYGLRWKLSSRALKETGLSLVVTLLPLTAIALRWPGLALPRSPSLRVAAAQIVAGFVAAVIEETFFRGWVQTLLSRHLRPSLAIVVTSCLFALSHRIVRPEPIFLATFFPGLIMGLLRHRHGSVAPSVLYHGLGNVWAVWFFPLR